MFLRFELALFLSLVPMLSFAEDAVRIRRVAFRDGHATINGAIKGYETADYVFPAGAGESIRINMKTSALSAYFNVNPPGSEEAVFNGSISGLSYEGVASMSGDYTARVYMMRNAARRGKTARYALTFDVGLRSAGKDHGPDFADGLSGGPDYWEVIGLAKGELLAMRQAPSPKGKQVSVVLNTAVLKNHGCKNIRGQRWCQVEDGGGRQGWVSGKHLREAAWPPQ